MRQTIAIKSKVCLSTFMDCFYLQCPFDDPSQVTDSPSWVHVVCHTICSSCSLHSWQLPVSFIPLRLFFPLFPSISFHSQALLLLSQHGVSSNTQGYTQKHTYRFAIPRFISLYFRSTPSFIHFSRIQSTATYNLRALRPAMAAGLTCFLYPLRTLSHNKKARQTLAYNVAVHHPFRISVATTIAGTRPPIPSCFLHWLLAARP